MIPLQILLCETESPLVLYPNFRRNLSLLLATDDICPAVVLIVLGEIESALRDVLDATVGSPVVDVVLVLAELSRRTSAIDDLRERQPRKTHLERGDIFGARAHLHLVETSGEVELFLHLGGAALDAHGEEGSGES